MRSRNSSKSTGTQFLHINSLIQFMAMTPSLARSDWPTIWPVLPCPLPPLAGRFPGAESPFEVGRGLVLIGCWHPKRAKWKIEARRDGVIEVERGIQLKRWAKHSSASRHRAALSASRIICVLLPPKTPTEHDKRQQLIQQSLIGKFQLQFNYHFVVIISVLVDD